jgi:hypothetical protein
MFVSAGPYPSADRLQSKEGGLFDVNKDRTLTKKSTLSMATKRKYILGHMLSYETLVI